MSTQRGAARPGRVFYGWWIVVSLFVINFAVEATAIFSFAVFLKPMSEDLNISRGAISWVMAGRRIASGVATLALGPLVDRYGARALICIATAVAGLAVAALGWVNSFWVFFLLFAVVGLSGVTMPGNVLTSVPVAKWFIRSRGRATALTTAGFGIGGTVFVIVHQQLIDSIGWRWTWVLSGVFTIAVVLPAALLIRRTPEDMGLQPDGGPAPVRRAVAAEPEPGRPTADEDSWTGREALRTWALWKVMASYVLISFAMGGVQLHRAAFWEDRGYDRALIAGSFSLDALVFFAGILAAGFLVERFHVRHVGALAMAVSVGGVVLTVAVDATWVLLVSAIALGIGQGTNAVVQVHIWPTYFGRAHLGAIRAYVFPPVLIAQALGAPFAGFFFDVTGTYLAAFWIGAGAVGAAAVLLAWASPPRRHRPAEAHSGLSAA